MGSISRLLGGLVKGATGASRLPPEFARFTEIGRSGARTDAALAAVQDALKAGRPPNSGVPLVSPASGTPPTTAEALASIADALKSKPAIAGLATAGGATALSPGQAEALPIKRTMPQLPNQNIADAMAAMASQFAPAPANPAMIFPEMFKNEFAPNMLDPRTYQARPGPMFVPNSQGKIVSPDQDDRLLRWFGDAANIASNFVGP